jgi:uncharacterized membrane protein (DUF485 family)
MVHGDHVNLATDAVRDEAVERFNARLGLALFAVYLLVYAVYVLVNAFSPSTMDKVPFAGLNVAVISGFGLIIGAFAMSLVYMALCRSPRESRP